MSKRTRRGPGAIRERIARRRRLRLLAIPLVLLVAAAGAGAYLLSREDPRPPIGTNVARGLAEGPQRVIFADFGEGRMLREHLVAEDQVRDLVRLPHLGDMQAAPASSYVSIDWWDEDAGGPRVTILNPRTGDHQVIEGFAQESVWHPTGELIAYSEPLEPERCTTNGCPGDVRIHAFDPATRSSELMVEGGPWFPRFWVGDRILYQDEDDVTIVHIEGPQGERTTIEVWAPGVLGPSPDGRWLFVSWEEETAFYPLGPDGSVAGDPVAVDVPARAGLGIAVWAHDSSAVVGAAGTRRPELLFLSPTEPQPRQLIELEGRVTRLTAGPDNDHVLVTTATDRFETSVCSVDEEAAGDRCRAVFDWTSGISPLRLEGSAV